LRGHSSIARFRCACTQHDVHVEFLHRQDFKCKSMQSASAATIEFIPHSATTVTPSTSTQGFEGSEGSYRSRKTFSTVRPAAWQKTLLNGNRP
jgi:hypothetical protein